MPDPTPPAASPMASPFQRLLDGVEDGGLREQLDRELHTLIAALTTQASTAGGKPKATLTVALEFKLDSGVIEVTGDLKTKLPRPVRAKSIFWPTRDNELAKNNPRQVELALAPRNVITDGDARTIRALP